MIYIIIRVIHYNYKFLIIIFFIILYYFKIKININYIKLNYILKYNNIK